MTNTSKRDKDDEKDVKLQIPLHLTLKEVLAVLGVVISGLGAWGAFQTKVAVLEQTLAFHQKSIDKLEEQVKGIQVDNQAIHARLIENASPSNASRTHR